MSKLLAFMLLCSTVSIKAVDVTNINDLSQVTGGNIHKYVILDTDMGADDAWALQMLLNAEKQLKNVKLLAVTTVDGNTDVDNVIKNTYHVLHGLNRTDIPIYRGASEAIIPTNMKNDHFYGMNAFADLDYWQPHYPKDVQSIVAKRNAIEIIRELVMKYPNKVSLLCLAPLTNIGLAIKTYPEIKENIGEIFVMGGAFKGRGNVVPAAEFNFYHDPESVYIVLNSLKCPITILPLESDEGITVSMKWRNSAFSEHQNDIVAFLNEVDKIALKNEQLFLPADTFTSAAFLFPAKMIQVMNKYNVTIELAGQQTRGAMVINHLSTDYNVNIIEKINGDEFKKIMLWTASYSY